MTDSKTVDLSAEIYDYMLQSSSEESTILRELRAETAKLPLARMQIAPEQGRFMSMLVRLSGARRALEIGVFTGYSALCIADGLPEDGLLTACDINTEWTNIAEKYWQRAGVRERIDLCIAPALDTLRSRLQFGDQGSYDFAFIDADKENYLAYYEACLQLLRPGGLMCIDNVLWSGKVLETDSEDEETRAIQQLNTHIAEDDRVEAVMLNIADGLTLALKKP